MRRLFVIVAVMVLVGRVFAAHIPAPTGYVNDFIGVLTAKERETLETDLAGYQESTGNEIAIALIKSLDGDSVEEFAVRTFEEWKIGKKGKDNGILFLAAIDDRKMRIEVGYGLEPYLTDGEAGELLRTAVTPAFRAGKYGEGVMRAVESIKRELSGEAADSRNQSFSDSGNRQFPIPFSILIIIFIYLFAFMARSKSVWLGGVAGGALGGAVGWWLGSVATGVVLAIFLSLIGLLLDAILSRNYEVNKAAGGQTGFFGSRGGFWTSSGRSSSGSFGGFSGGSSGGGGSSGSW